MKERGKLVAGGGGKLGACEPSLTAGESETVTVLQEGNPNCSKKIRPLRVLTFCH